MAEKIVYLRQSADLVRILGSPDVAWAVDIQKNFMGKGFYARQGLDVWPFGFQRDFWQQIMPVTLMPEPGARHLDFEACTEQVFQRLKKTQWDRPWVVDWSGGIDSTVIVVALLRNLSAADLQNVTINLNAFSYWENPDFYTNHIRPNFRCVNSHDYNQTIRHQPHYRLHGEPADMLWGAAKALQARKDGVDLARSWRDLDPRWLIFNQRLWGTDASQWILDVMDQSIQSVPQYGVETVADWYWWLNFNFKWVQKMAYDFGHRDRARAQQYFDTVVPWYADPAYQLWSINHGRFSLLDTRLEAYKTEAKDYIWSWDHNDLYRKFKLKFNSASRPETSQCWAITDKFRYLDHAQLAQELNLLQQHRVEQ